MQVENAKLKLFEQLLAQKIASNHSIDPTDGVEPVENLKLGAKFSENVIIEEKKKVLEEAKKCRAGSVIGTDGSKLSQGNVGSVLSWKDRDLNGWKSTSLFLGKNKEILDGELWAISDGLKMVTTLNNQNTSVTIFSDSREALTSIRQPTP